MIKEKIYFYFIIFTIIILAISIILLLEFAKLISEKDNLKCDNKIMKIILIKITDYIKLFL